MLFAAIALVCSAELWEHVYRPQRFTMIELCKTVEGRVIQVRGEPDGDYHIKLLLDNGRKLLVEAICEKEVTQADAIGPCKNSPVVPLPEYMLGHRVRVIGPYVRDRQHHWLEIHPVSKMEIIP